MDEIQNQKRSDNGPGSDDMYDEEDDDDLMGTTRKRLEARDDDDDETEAEESDDEHSELVAAMVKDAVQLLKGVALDKLYEDTENASDDDAPLMIPTINWAEERAAEREQVHNRRSRPDSSEAIKPSIAMRAMRGDFD